MRNLLIIGGTAGPDAAISGAAGGGKGAAIGAAAGAGAGTLGAYLTGKREIVLPVETVLTFHVYSVTISEKELDRLQRASDGRRSADSRRSEDRSVVRSRHHGDDDEDDDDDDEHEHERGRRYERPQHVDVVFVTGHRAGVEICWPHRVERLTLRGDDLEEILEPLAERTRVPVEFLRPRVKIKRED